MKKYIQTFTGRYVCPLALDPDDICIEDIAHALAMQCRFGGHVKHFYSVAEHSVRCSSLVPPREALHALLHDASECYLMDMTRPVKHTPEMSMYREIEAQVERAIALRFGIPSEKTLAVECADKAMLVLEARALLHDGAKDYRQEWVDLADAVKLQLPSFKIGCWNPVFAERNFLDRYAELAL